MPINQTVTISANPERVYQALTSAEEFSEFTGAAAEIAQGEGGTFSCFGGQITGHHAELVPNERIVQAWRVGMWDEGVHSTVIFNLSASGESTTIEFEQTGYPDGTEEHLETGWHNMYWNPLKAHLE